MENPKKGSHKHTEKNLSLKHTSENAKKKRTRKCNSNSLINAEPEETDLLIHYKPTQYSRKMIRIVGNVNRLRTMTKVQHVILNP